MIFEWMEQNIDKVENYFKVAIESVLIFFIGWWVAGIVSRYFKKMMERAKIDAGIVSFIISILKICLKVIVILSAASRLGIPIAPILTALGAATVTVSLALKDSFSNVASGVLIVANRMFSVGDYIKVGEFEGNVKKVELFFTTLLTGDNKQVLIPNSTITSNSIVNYTALDKRRLELNYTVDSGSNVEKAKNIIKSVIENEPRFINTPSPVIEVSGYKNNGVSIAVKVWCNTSDYSDLYFYLQTQVKNGFDKNNIQMAF